MAEGLLDKLGQCPGPRPFCSCALRAHVLPHSVSSLAQLPLPGPLWHREQEEGVRVVMARLTLPALAKAR